MARRTQIDRPRDDRDYAAEFTRLRRTLRAHEPSSPAEAVSGQIMEAAIEIERREPDMAKACDELAAFIESIGVATHAEAGAR